MIEVWIVIAFAVAILGYGLSGMIGGHIPEKPMPRDGSKAMSLGAFLRSRGVNLEEVEQSHKIKTGPGSHDSYDNAGPLQQCAGIIMRSQRPLDDTGTDRCRQKTKHPSGLCPQHRRQVR